MASTRVSSLNEPILQAGTGGDALTGDETVILTTDQDSKERGPGSSKPASVSTQSDESENARVGFSWRHFFERLQQAIGLIPISSPAERLEHEVQAFYKPRNSFLKYIPVTSFDKRRGVYRMADVNVVGVVMDVIPVDIEGIPDEAQERVRQLVQTALKSVNANKGDPWVVQTFTHEESYDPDSLKEKMVRYAKDANAYTKLTVMWIDSLIAFISRAGQKRGYFKDPKTNARFGVHQTKTRLLMYRDFSYRQWPDYDGLFPEDYANEAALNIASQFEEIGVAVKRVDDFGFREWLMPFFTPENDGEEMLDVVRRKNHILKANGAAQATHHYDLGKSVIRNAPFVDAEDTVGTFAFGDYLYAYVPIEGILEKPKVGHFTIEHKRSTSVTEKKAMQVLKLLPPESMIATTTVLLKKDHIRQLLALRESQLGAWSEARDLIESEIKIVREAMNQDELIGSVAMGVYVRAKDKHTLLRNIRQVVNTLEATHFEVIDPREANDPEDLRTRFVQQLPFSYRLSYEKELDLTRLWYLEDIAAVLPVYGRSIGTGSPGITLTNRDGSIIQVDPIRDRKKNSHLIGVGPSGAGKSSTANYIVKQLVAMNRPYLHIIDYGGSYDYLIEQFKEAGLKVKKREMRIGKGEGAFAPFADAVVIAVGEAHPRYDKDIDYLANMSYIAKLMATGGEERELQRFHREHTTILNNGIELAGHLTHERGADQTLIQDVVDALRMMSRQVGEIPHIGREYSQKEKEFSEDLANKIEPFIKSKGGDFFASETHIDDDDYDVLVYEAGMLADNPQYREQLLVFFMSAFMHFIAVLQKKKYSRRRVLLLVDEAHKYTEHPIILPFMDSAFRTIRKLGGIMWLFTQTLADLARTNDGKKGGRIERMLQQIEWWLILSLEGEEKEAEYIKEFRSSDEAEIQRILSSSKEPGFYVEAALKSPRVDLLARVVQPGRDMAMAYTEPDERADIIECATEHGVSEYEATKIVGDGIERDREKTFSISLNQDDVSTEAEVLSEKAA